MEELSGISVDAESGRMGTVADGDQQFGGPAADVAESVCQYMPGSGRRPANGRVHQIPRDEWRDMSVVSLAGSWGESYREAPDGAGLLREARILIVGDCTLYRDYLAAVLASHGAVAPGVAWDLPSLIAAYETTVPRVILLDMSTRNSAMLLRQALKLSPQVRVIVLGVSEDDESEIVACAEAGVAGYHLRSDSLKDLLVLIHKVAAGESLCSPRVSAILLRRLSTLASQRQPVQKELVLTSREIQILRLLEKGLSNRDIAEQLCIAVHTVKNHVHSLLAKLGVSTRAQAAALARSTVFTEEALED